MKIGKKLLWALGGIIFLGFLLRLAFFNSITFSYDQARDAIISAGIFQGDLKILGPASDIAGLHHGILYWYLISPLYSLTGYGPYAVKIFLLLLNLGSIPVTFLLAKRIFKKTFIALFSAFLCAVSFESIQYSHWLSNPVPSFLTIPLSFYFLWQYVNNKNKYGLILTAFFWGLSVQLEIFLLYQAVVFVLILLIFKKFKVKDIVLALATGAFILSPFLVAEIKFGFAGILGSKSFFTGSLTSSGQTINEMASRASEKLVYIPYYNITANYVASIAIIIAFIVSSINFGIRKRDRRVAFLFVWFIFPVVLFFVGATNIYFAFIGSAIPFFILSSFYIDKIFIARKAYVACSVLLIIFLVSNLWLIYENRGRGEILFSVQQSMVLDQERVALDWIYKKAEGKPFRINTITNPLFINTTWSYLFDWYGRGKYGYMPFWWGYPQNGQFGENIAYSKDFEGSKDLIFLIIEPSNGIPDFYVREIYDFENSRSKVIDRKKIGSFVIEKRQITRDKPFSKQEIDEGIKNNAIKSKLRF